MTVKELIKQLECYPSMAEVYYPVITEAEADGADFWPANASVHDIDGDIVIA